MTPNGEGIIGPVTRRVGQVVYRRDVAGDWHGLHDDGDAPWRVRENDIIELLNALVGRDRESQGLRESLAKKLDDAATLYEDALRGKFHRTLVRRDMEAIEAFVAFAKALNEPSVTVVVGEAEYDRMSDKGKAALQEIARAAVKHLSDAQKT
jgi:hypothetical protein